MSDDRFVYDGAATNARYDALKAVQAAPMSRVEMTDKWREVGGAGRPEEQMMRGLCPSCLNSGFVHVMRAGQLGIVADVVTGKIARCYCERGQRVDR